MFKSINEAAEHYISRDVLCCDSSFVNDLLYRQNQAQNPITEEFCIDNIENFYDKDRDTILHYLHYCLHQSTISDYLKDNDGTDIALLNQNELEELAEACEWEAEPQEIYEWWRVTDWLAEKLSERGQPILRNAYGTWWGRTATGQAISLDGTFQAIAQLLMPELPEAA